MSIGKMAILPLKGVNLNQSFIGVVSRRFFSSNEISKNHYDIVIAGGGMVGTTLACALGKTSKLSNRKILLLEGMKQKQTLVADKYSNRVSSLNSGTIELLTEIGAWPKIKRYSPVKKLQVWDGISNSMITFDNEEDNVSYIVENDVLLEAVNNVVKDIQNVEVLYEAKIKNYHLPEYDEQQVKIHLERGEEYTCDLLLGCDGANSQVRKAMQVHYLNWNYDQMGVVATLKLDELFENTTAWQRFLPTGPVAILPLNNNMSSLVWSTTPQHAKELVKMSEEEFIDSLNSSLCSNNNQSETVNQVTRGFSNFLRFFNCPANIMQQLPPKICSCEEGSRAAFPLGFGHSTNYIRKGVVLVGDAAHRVHPLAGQGVNLGFGDVQCLTRVLRKAAYSGSRLDNLSYLKEYESERQRHNVPTILAVDGLHRLYNTSFTPLVLLRSLGLQTTNALDPLKRMIIQHASV